MVCLMLIQTVLYTIRVGVSYTYTVLRDSFKLLRNRKAQL